MAAATAAGIEVLALADHNSCEWAEPMIEAGKRAGVVVFPGMEITTGTGADGIHLVVIADPATPPDEFRQHVHSVCGFDHINLPFQPNGTPAAAPRTLQQILDHLPEEYLVIAPHGFNDNGIASERTVKGDLRWKALHHPRLSAIDIGDATGLLDGSVETFHGRFARREFDHFPCLPTLAFVSTSDAYQLEDLGTRYTWIRMESPTLEGLRQAFLDHGARLACDWDPRYSHADANPNDVSHAWVESVTLSGVATIAGSMTVSFDPRLNVIIGGRGAGKSTIVAALRSAYGDTRTLPAQARVEAEKLIADVFADAQVRSKHRLPHSGEAQSVGWSKAEGSLTYRSLANPSPTDFKVRVVNQKELFERAAHTADDRHATSRNLLALVDEALAPGQSGPGSAQAFGADLEEVATAWVSAARHLEAERVAVGDRALLEQRVEELDHQVAAFDNEVNRQRRERNDLLLSRAAALDQFTESTQAAIESARADVARRLAISRPTIEQPAAEPFDELLHLVAEVEAIREDASAAVDSALADADAALAMAMAGRASGPWHDAVTDAAEDAQRYLDDLAALGLDPDAYGQVRLQQAEQNEALSELDRRSEGLTELESEERRARAALEDLIEARRSERADLLESVADRSEMLRFTVNPASDTTAWASRIRSLLNLRSDGFLEEMPALAEWLWGSGPHPTRLEMWRKACITGDFAALGQAARLRPAWRDRLAALDALIRARLAAEIAEDTVEMFFLREGGSADIPGDWQPLTAGSPGQRSAAMLSFVLHQGTEPLVLDQPEDDLDTEWITQLVVRQLRTSRWTRQLVIVTHNANIPVNADAERVIVLENLGGGVRVRTSELGDGTVVVHCGPLENEVVRADIQQIMEGGIEAFVRRERRYNNELHTYRAAMQQAYA